MSEHQQGEKGSRFAAVFAVIAVLLCCGAPFLLAAGVSLSLVWLSWPVIGLVVLVLGLAGSIWYIKRRRTTSPHDGGSSGNDLR